MQRSVQSAAHAAAAPASAATQASVDTLAAAVAFPSRAGIELALSMAGHLSELISAIEPHMQGDKEMPLAATACLHRRMDEYVCGILSALGDEVDNPKRIRERVYPAGVAGPVAPAEPGADTDDAAPGQAPVQRRPAQRADTEGAPLAQAQTFVIATDLAREIEDGLRRCGSFLRLLENAVDRTNHSDPQSVDRLQLAHEALNDGMRRELNAMDEAIQSVIASNYWGLK